MDPSAKSRGNGMRFKSWLNGSPMLEGERKYGTLNRIPFPRLWRLGPSAQSLRYAGDNLRLNIWGFARTQLQQKIECGRILLDVFSQSARISFRTVAILQSAPSRPASRVLHPRPGSIRTRFINGKL